MHTFFGHSSLLKSSRMKQEGRAQGRGTRSCQSSLCAQCKQQGLVVGRGQTRNSSLLLLMETLHCTVQMLLSAAQVVDGSGAKRHAPSVAHWVREAMVGRRVLLATDGPYANVLKVKPPMCFGRAEADQLVQQLAQARLHQTEMSGVGLGLGLDEVLARQRDVCMPPRKRGVVFVLPCTPSSCAQPKLAWRSAFRALLLAQVLQIGLAHREHTPSVATWQ